MLSDLDPVDLAFFMLDLAGRAGTIDELAAWYECTEDEISVFVEDNRSALTQLRDRMTETKPITEEDNKLPEVTSINELWISSKLSRLQRLQKFADDLYAQGPYDAVTAREFRAYLMLAANELGQLLHRGSGDDTNSQGMNVSFGLVDMEKLK